LAVKRKDAVIRGIPISRSSFMSIEVSHETEARIVAEVRQLTSQDAAELPLWHLGDPSPLPRRDIYDDGV
jgi:hypothetical protein